MHIDQHRGYDNDSNNEIKSIFDLRYHIRKTFFHDFEASHELPDGIKGSHMKALMFLRMEGPCQMSLISDKANLEKGSFTVVANRLLELGYIEKIQDEDDKRAFNLVLTDKGRDLTDQIAAAHCAHIAEQLDKLTPQEQELFHSSLNMVIALIKKCE